MTRPLEGRRVALAESRQLDELVRLLEKEGASPLPCPMVGILDAPDPAPVVEWLRELTAGGLDVVVLMTGEGLRRLLGFAERFGLRENAIAALRKTLVITRGPKPALALREVDLGPGKAAEAPTTAGVVAALRKLPLKGRTVGVTLYGEPNPVLVEFLEGAGAAVRTVLPYIYAPAADADRVADLIERLARGDVDAIVFTSSAQLDRLFEVAAARGLEGMLRMGLDRVRVAAVGPIMAEKLQTKGIRVDVRPEQGFVMKNLVAQLARNMDKKDAK
ncbi:MAG TPA: uroporphyrinogen-III synthase [Gemmataceae bacterium]|nr:uroporphyrinogen-III synthase [Gemmataceae bacterium]